MMTTKVNFCSKLLRSAFSFQSPVTRKRFYHVLRDWSAANDTIIPVDTCPDHSLIDKPTTEPLHLKHVLLFKKRTRLEFEMANATKNNRDFAEHAKSLGSDYKTLLERHNEHYRELDKLLACLKKRHVKIETMTRLEFNQSVMDNVDAVITAGGDGTFLLVSGWVKDNRLPLIGFNTDPSRSQGHLCLPVLNVEDIFDRLDAGKFRYVNRQRIESSISAVGNVTVTDLHFPGRPSFEFPLCTLPPDPEEPGFVCLPSLGLNEVFVGESCSAITSYYEMGIDDAPMFKQKSSGVTIATGTGSTSWYHTISAMHPTVVESLLKTASQVAVDKGLASLPLNDPGFVESVAKAFNTGIQFHPEERRMAFAARDTITNEIYKLTNPRGFASKLHFKSRMMDGGLVVDSGAKYAFSLGSEAILRIAPSSMALRTVSLFNARKPTEATS